MLETQNLKLKKPEDNDILDPSLSINPNMDIIDNEIGKIKEDIENMSSDATGTSYDNTNSKLAANNVQGAIDEVNAKTNENKTSISDLEKKTDTTNTGLSDLKTKVDNGQNYKLTRDDGDVNVTYNMDFNAITKTGFYYGTSPTNSPVVGGAWFLEVISRPGGFLYQRATKNVEGDKVLPKYERTIYNNAWTSWRSL